MELTLKNPAKTTKSTISELWAGLSRVCLILEDEDKLSQGKQKEFGTTAIPAGRYKIAITRSNRFSKMLGHDIFLPELLDVPGYSGVRIHTGNKPADTEGCLLPGMTKGDDFVSESRKAMEIIMNLLTTSKEDNFITILR